MDDLEARAHLLEDELAAGVLAATRALRAGELADAEKMLGPLLPRLDERGAREPALWLRLELAAALGRAGRGDEAEAILATALAQTAAGSGERMAAAAEVMRLWLDAGLPSDALAIGITVLDAPASGPRTLHAEVLVLCAVALTAMGERDESARFLARAEGFDSPGLAEARRRLA